MPKKAHPSAPRSGYIESGPTHPSCDLANRRSHPARSNGCKLPVSSPVYGGKSGTPAFREVAQKPPSEAAPTREHYNFATEGVGWIKGG